MRGIVPTQLYGNHAASRGGIVVPPIAFVRQAVETTADGSIELTATFGVSAGVNSLIIACITFLDTASFGDTGPGIGPATNNNVLLTQAVTSTITGVKSYIYYIHGAGVEAPDSVKYILDLPVRASMHISEWSGIPNAASQDTSSGTGTSTSMSIVPATQDPTSLNNLVVGIGGYVNATDAYSSGPSNSFTRLTATGGSAVFQEEGYLIRTADGAAVTSVTTLGSSLAWAGVSVSFGGN